MTQVKEKKLQDIQGGSDQSKRLAIFRSKYIAKSSSAAAELLGYNRSLYWKIEQGQVKINIKLIELLVEKYKLNPDFILNGDLPMQDNAKQHTPGASLTQMAAMVSNLERIIMAMKKNTDMVFDKMEDMEKTIAKQQKEIEELKSKIK